MKYAVLTLSVATLALAGCASDKDFYVLAARTQGAAKSYQADLDRFVATQNQLIVSSDERLKRLNAETATRRAGVRRQTSAWAVEGRADLVARQQIVASSATGEEVAADLAALSQKTPSLDASEINKKLKDGLEAQAKVVEPPSLLQRVKSLVDAGKIAKGEFDRLDDEADKAAKANDKAADKAADEATKTAPAPSPAS